MLSTSSNSFTIFSLYFSILQKGVLISLLFTLVACGGGSDESSTAVITGQELNPYLPPDKSSTWYYNDSSSGVRFSDAIVVDNRSLDVLVYPTSGKEYYSTDNVQIAIKGFYAPSILVSGVGTFNADFMFDEALVLWKSGYLSGATGSINTSGTVNIKPSYGLRGTSLTGTSTFHGVETVTVPYGTFEAIHVSYNISVSATIEGLNIDIPWSGELWLVEGMGIVQRSENGTTFMLTNYDGKDSDGDGISDFVDKFPNDANEQIDTDSDGIGNNADVDDDGDGVDDINDKFPLNPAASDDTDDDGIDDSKDNDDDNDGHPDVSDYYPLDPELFEPLTTNSAKFTSTPVLGDSDIISHTLEISGTNIDWTLSSSAAWLQLSQNSGSGDQLVTLTVDANSLSVGLHEAQLTLTNKLDASEQTIAVTTDIILPTLSLSVGAIKLDGTYSWKDLAESLQISLNTGNNSYGLTYSINFPNSGVFSVDAVTAVSENLSGIDVEVIDPAELTEGVYDGEIIFTATVMDEEISATLDVEVLASKHLLLVPDSGVALSKFVTVDKLSHSVDILDSYGLTSTNWIATTSAPWITVTAAGTISDVLTITADAAGLTVDTLHTATITVSSSDAGIENSQTINVGFWVGSSDPAASTSINATYSKVTSDPVRPYVYLNAGGTSIDVYNVYDQSSVTTISAVGTTLGEMEVSADGQYLYVADTNDDSVIIIDLDNTSNRSSWTSTDSLAAGFTLSKTNDRELLISGYGNLYDAQTGTLYVGDAHRSYYGFNYLDASLFGNRFCAVNSGISPYTVTCYDLNYSSYSDQVLVSMIDGAVPHGTGSNGRDVALNNEGTIAYTASGAPYVFIPINIDTMTVGVNLPADSYPTAVEIGPDNALHGASSSSYGPTDIWIYESSGILRTSDYISGYTDEILDRALAISGDGFISIAITSNPSVAFVSGF